MEQQNEIIGAKIIVIGVGGAGTNAVNMMVDSNVKNVEFFVLNTDAQSLLTSRVDSKNKLVLGPEITKGLGAGGDPEVGRKAAEASEAEIRAIVKDANMVFIASGMGGGTGSGAAPVVASICRDEGCLTFAIVTRPFGFEGPKRKSIAISALKNLSSYVDSYIVVSNDKLLMTAGSESIKSAFNESDKVLYQGVQTIVDLIVIPGIINLDFADIKNTLKDSGITLIGYGEGKGSNRVNEAVNIALTPSLLETDISGAKKAICSVTCGKDVSLYEAQECVARINESARKCDDIKFGITVDEKLEDCIKVSVIASGFAEDEEVVDVLLDSSFYNKDETNNDANKKPDETIKDKPASLEKEEENEEDDILPNYLKNH